MKEISILDADWCPVDDEDLKVQHTFLLKAYVVLLRAFIAQNYSYRKAIERYNDSRRMDRMVDNLFNGAVILFALAGIMAYFAG